MTNYENYNAPIITPGSQNTIPVYGYCETITITSESVSLILRFFSLFLNNLQEALLLLMQGLVSGITAGFPRSVPDLFFQ